MGGLQQLSRVRVCFQGKPLSCTAIPSQLSPSSWHQHQALRGFFIVVLSSSHIPVRPSRSQVPQAPLQRAGRRCRAQLTPLTKGEF